MKIHRQCGSGGFARFCPGPWEVTAATATGAALGAVAGTPLGDDAAGRFGERCQHAGIGRSVAPGNHRCPWHGGVEQRALFQLSVNLRTVVQDVRSDAAAGAPVQEVAEGNRDLFHRTQTQANNLAVTASAMEEITSTVHSSAASAAQGAQLAAQTKTLTGSGHDAMEAAGHTMDEIAHASQDIQGIVLIEGGSVSDQPAGVERCRGGRARR